MNDKLKALFKAVRLMRFAQRQWFRTKNKQYLTESFRLEKQVDDLITELEPLVDQDK